MGKCIHAVLNNFQILFLIESMFAYLSKYGRNIIQEKEKYFCEIHFLSIDTKHFYISDETMEFGRKFRETRTPSQNTTYQK